MNRLLSIFGLLLTVAVCLFGAVGAFRLAHEFASWPAQDFYYGLSVFFVLMAVGFAVLFVQASRDDV